MPRFDLATLTFNENSNHWWENHWKSGVPIPAPEGPKNFEIFFVLCSFHFQIIHTKLVTEDGTTFFKILCQFPDFPSFLICAKATALARILNLAHKVYYFQVPIKRVGPNKQVVWRQKAVDLKRVGLLSYNLRFPAFFLHPICFLGPTCLRNLHKISTLLIHLALLLV